jgi:hypothetical protein
MTPAAFARAGGRQKLLALIWLASLCLPRSLNAQVNVEPLRREIASTGAAAHLAGSITSYLGNTEGVTLGGIALIGGRHGRHMGYATGSADYSHLGGNIQAAKAFGHIRHNYQLLPYMWSELFAQMEADRFRRISLRELFGAGSRFRISESSELNCFYGTAYMLEYTRLSPNAGPADRSTLAHRSSNYLSLTWTPDQRTTLSETFYVQPRFDDFSDAQLLSVMSLEFKISAWISSRIDASLRYDSRHPPEVKAYDLEIKNLLDFRL